MLIIGSYEIDAAVSEEPQFDNEVTEHPVESGANVADHVNARPGVLVVEGIVSDTPIGPLADRRAADASDGELLDPTPPSDDAFARLVAISEARQPVTVETSRRTHQNMVLESLSERRDASSGEALRFRATFRQIRVVTNQRTTIRVAVPRASKKIDRGHKPSLSAPEETTPPAVTTDENVDDLKTLRP